MHIACFAPCDKLSVITCSAEGIRPTAPVLLAIASLSFSQQLQNASVYDVEVAVAAPAVSCSTISLLCG